MIMHVNNAVYSHISRLDNCSSLLKDHFCETIPNNNFIYDLGLYYLLI